MDDSTISVLPAEASLPYDWSPEELVNYLSRRRRAPQLQKFFSSEVGRGLFIENDIGGNIIFNNDFTEDTIQNELGIKNIGVRMTLWSVIRQLRARYPQPSLIEIEDDLLLPPPPPTNLPIVIKNEDADDDEETHNLSGGNVIQPQVTIIRVGPIESVPFNTGYQPPVEYSPTLVSTPGPSRLATRLPHSVFRVADSEDNERPQEEEDPFSNSQQIPTPRSPTPAGDVEARTPERLRINFGDEAAIRERVFSRLVTPVPEHELSLSASMDISDDDSAVLTPMEDEDHVTITGDITGMEDIPPVPENRVSTPQDHEEEMILEEDAEVSDATLSSTTRNSSSLPRAKRKRRTLDVRRRYLPKQPLTASEMTLVREDPNDEDKFVISRKNSPGAALAANRLMTAFLMKKSVATSTIDGKQHRAYRHQFVRHVQRYQRDPITVITKDEVRPGEDIKEYIDEFPSLDVKKQIYRKKQDRVQLLRYEVVGETNPERIAEQNLDKRFYDPHSRLDGTEWLNALKDKWEARQKLLEDNAYVPTHYRSRSESPGLDPLTIKEIRLEENEREEARLRQEQNKPLTRDEIADVFNEMKAAITEKWKEKRLPKLEGRKYSIWKLPKGCDRRVKIAQNNKYIHDLGERLKQHLEGYQKEKWFSLPKLKTIIRGNSRLSIEELEKFSWHNSIIKGPCPEKPVKVRVARVGSRKIIEEAEDIEEDEQTGDDEESDDDMDEFIVPDDLNDAGVGAARSALLEGNRWKDGEFAESGNWEDVELPDAENATGNQDTPNIEKGKSKEKGVIENVRWFSNDPLTNTGEPSGISTKGSDPMETREDDAAKLRPTPATPVHPATPDLAGLSNTGPFVMEEATPPPPRPSTPNSAVKPEPMESVIMEWSSKEVIDLTIDDTPLSTPTKSRVAISSANGSDENDEDTDFQRAIAESLQTARKEDFRNSLSTLFLEQPSVAESSKTAAARPYTPATEAVQKEKPIICGPEGKKCPWKADLQEIYDGCQPDNASKLSKMRKLAKWMSTSENKEVAMQRVLLFWDRSKGKYLDLKTLGFDTGPYIKLCSLYFKWSFPEAVDLSQKQQRDRIKRPMNLARFLGEITPILDDIEEYESSTGGNHAALGESSHPEDPARTPDNQGVNTGNISSTAEGKTMQKGKAREGDQSLFNSVSEYRETASPRPYLEGMSSPAASQDTVNSQTRRTMKNRKEIIDNETVQNRIRKKKDQNNIQKRVREQAAAGRGSQLINLGHKGGLEAEIEFPHDQGLPLYHFQKEGIQFLWKNLVMSPKRTGALLAHTMGMGKTRQVITLLSTIINAAKSTKTKLVEQIPPELRKMRALVVCPPGLVQNWKDEIGKWASESLRPVYLLTSGTSTAYKVDVIKKWKAEGSILVTGYDILLKLCQDNATAHADLEKALALPTTDNTRETAISKAGLTSRLTERLREILLETPTLVVADEAHKIKNKRSQITVLFHEFKTRSRIAMTGSPLANDLAEFFHIMRWIDPDYVGSEAEFNNNFKLPIQDGLYIDSLPEEIRRSNTLQRKLQTLWAPKMHRVNIASILDIENTLPPKTEFLITLQMTEFQKELYRLYAGEATKDVREGYCKGFFDFVKQLGLVLNHPAIFKKSFNDRQKKQNSAAGNKSKSAVESSANESDDDDNQEDGEKESPPVAAPIVQKIKDLFSRHKALGEKIQDAYHSYRIQALFKIIDACVKLKEKVLVFSQSIDTLNYIGEQLDQKSPKIKYVRIDSSVDTSKRQEITKKFNNDGDETYVFLISTKSGGLGFNIQAARRVVVFDFQFSPQDEEQAVGRAYRLGQKKHVFVYRFRIGGTYEDVIFNKSLLKMSLAARIVDKKTVGRFSKRSQAEDWFKPPRDVPRIETEFEGLKGKDAVMDGLLEEDWVRGLTTQDTYEAHYDDPCDEEIQEATEDGLPPEGGLSGGPGVDATGAGNEAREGMNLVAAAGESSHKQTDSGLANPSTPSTKGPNNEKPPGRASLTASVSNIKGSPKSPGFKAGGKRDLGTSAGFAERMKKAQDSITTSNPTTTAGPSIPTTTSARSKLVPPTGPSSSSTRAGPSRSSSSSRNPPPDRRFEGVNSDRHHIRETHGPDQMQRGMVPPPLILPSQRTAHEPVLPSQRTPHGPILPSQREHHGTIIPSQRQSDEALRSPQSSTRPLSERVSPRTPVSEYEDFPRPNRILGSSSPRRASAPHVHANRRHHRPPPRHPYPRPGSQSPRSLDHRGPSNSSSSRPFHERIS